jgi:RimJ/RimL family protein N-acetyltransferase
MKITGERLVLKILSETDNVSEYVQWMQDEEITQYLESRWKSETEESIREYIQSANSSHNNFLFGIFLKDGGEHIGNIKIGSVNWIHRFGELGLILGNKKVWGKGYATEAVKLATEYAFKELNLHKLIAGMYSTNVGSYKAFLKAGYREVGVMQSHVFSHGEYIDSILVEKLSNS